MKPFNQRWQRFLSRRIPPSSEVVLNQRRLFIFPTRAGFFFLLCLLVMLMAAINYQNNMSYALTFLLANLFVIAVLHTFANLSGVRLRSAGSQGVFAGQLAQFTFNLDATGKANRHTIVVEWPGVSQAQLAQVSDAPQSVVLSCEVGERGWYKAPRIKVSSVYPLGLLRCWSWVDLDMRVLVYPRPAFTAPNRQSSSPAGDRREKESPAGEDFHAIRPYREGDPIKHIHWPAYARSQSLQSKVYAIHEGVSHYLDWDDYAGLGVELRLSALCDAVLRCEREKESYALRLPAKTLERGVGEGHRLKALKMLALYQRGVS